VNAAVQEDVDAIGLSILSGAHLHYFQEIKTLLEARAATDILLFGGGIIPEGDVATLQSLGVHGIFTPGTSTGDVVEFLKRAVPERWAQQ
jgi:methylmalonyl-CoA mutase, C-terminal domain